MHTHIYDYEQIIWTYHHHHQRRLRGDSSEDESYAAAKGWNGDHIHNVHGHHVANGRTYDAPFQYGNPAHHSRRTHHSHYTNTKATKQQEKAYQRWKHQHPPAYNCAWGKGACPHEIADLLADFFDKYEDEDIKVISDFLRARADDEYDESYDSGEYYYNYN